MPTHCQAINQRGKPCGAEPYRDGLCRWHHPSLEADRKRWSAKGGAARSNKSRAAKALPAEILTTDELISWLSLVFKQTIVGKTEPPVATACANLARTIAEIRRGAEIEDRLADVERLMGAGKRTS